MRIFRRKKKVVKFHRPSGNAVPLLDIMHQRGEEVAPQHVVYSPLPDSFFHAVNAARHEAGYEPLPVYPDVPVADENPLNALFETDIAKEIRAASPLNLVADIFNRSRSKSRDRRLSGSPDHFARANSPEHFAQRPLGLPVKFRRRPVSPELVQQRASSPFLFAQQQQRATSPFLFAQHQRAASADHLHRIQHAHLSQELQHLERQRQYHHEQQMFMAHQAQFFPQFQQQQFYPMMNPNLDMQAMFMRQQQPFYPLY